jgi:hypothetical protein
VGADRGHDDDGRWVCDSVRGSDKRRRSTGSRPSSPASGSRGRSGRRRTCRTGGATLRRDTASASVFGLRASTRTSGFGSAARGAAASPVRRSRCTRSCWRNASGVVVAALLVSSAPRERSRSAAVDTVPDAGAPDAGAPDARAPDAGAPVAGVPVAAPSVVGMCGVVVCGVAVCGVTALLRRANDRVSAGFVGATAGRAGRTSDSDSESVRRESGTRSRGGLVANAVAVPTGLRPCAGASTVPSVERRGSGLVPLGPEVRSVNGGRPARSCEVSSVDARRVDDRSGSPEPRCGSAAGARRTVVVASSGVGSSWVGVSCVGVSSLVSLPCPISRSRRRSTFDGSVAVAGWGVRRIVPGSVVRVCPPSGNVEPTVEPGRPVVDGRRPSTGSGRISCPKRPGPVARPAAVSPRSAAASSLPCDLSGRRSSEFAERDCPAVAEGDRPASRVARCAGRAAAGFSSVAFARISSRSRSSFGSPNGSKSSGTGTGATIAPAGGAT